MPTRPMSWCIGNQLTAQSDGEDPTPDGPLNASMFDERLRCVTTTPLGADVDPDVNWTKAISSAATSGCGSNAGARSTSQATTQRKSGQIARSASKCG